MSLAPTSSRGAFLKARLAVNGIQCAARSFGTLTAGAWGLLSSMGASLKVLAILAGANYQLRRGTGTSITCDIPDNSVGLLRLNPNPRLISRTLRPRNPRYRAIAAGFAETLPPAVPGHARSRRSGRPAASGAEALRPGCA